MEISTKNLFFFKKQLNIKYLKINEYELIEITLSPEQLFGESVMRCDELLIVFNRRSSESITSEAGVNTFCCNNLHDVKDALNDNTHTNQIMNRQSHSICFYVSSSMRCVEIRIEHVPKFYDIIN